MYLSTEAVSVKLYFLLTWWCKCLQNLFLALSTFFPNQTIRWGEEQAFWSNPEEIKGLRGEISLMRPSLIGKTGQDIIATNEKGGAVSLYGLTSSIKVLFIYSYDCEHCQKEAPEMVTVYNQWKNKGVDVLALSTDTDEAKWKAFIQNNNMTFHNALDPDRSSRYERKYHIDITPELYVLDKNNKIIASNLSPNQLPQFLEAERRRNPLFLDKPVRRLGE